MGQGCVVCISVLNLFCVYPPDKSIAKTPKHRACITQLPEILWILCVAVPRG